MSNNCGCLHLCTTVSADAAAASSSVFFDMLLLCYFLLPLQCLRSCPSGSAQWRLRPPAADLWGQHNASWSELGLMYVMLGSVLLHRCGSGFWLPLFIPCYHRVKVYVEVVCWG